MIKELFNFGKIEFENSITALCDWNIVLFKHIDNNGQRIQMQFKVPYYENTVPEKLIATQYTRRIVLEYTKIKQHTDKIVDWDEFEILFDKYFKLFIQTLKPS